MEKLKKNMKRTLVFSNDVTKQLIDRALGNRAEIDRTSISGAAEHVLLRALMPEQPDAWEAMMRIYLGDTTVKDEVASAFCLEAASVLDEGHRGTMMIMVSFALRHCGDAVLDCSSDEVHHAASCWGSVVNALSDNVDNGLVHGAVLENAKDLLLGLQRRRTDLRAAEFFRVAFDARAVLMEQSCVYRALMDIASMSSAWSEDAGVQEDFKFVLSRITHDWRG